MSGRQRRCELSVKRALRVNLVVRRLDILNPWPTPNSRFSFVEFAWAWSTKLNLGPVSNAACFTSTNALSVRYSQPSYCLLATSMRQHHMNTKPAGKYGVVAVVNSKTFTSGSVTENHRSKSSVLNPTGRSNGATWTTYGPFELPAVIAFPPASRGDRSVCGAIKLRRSRRGESPTNQALHASGRERRS